MITMDQSSYPNEIHQLLITVSKHFHIGAKGQLRHQFKKMDVTLDGLKQSGKEHVVYYFLRDHYTGVYYAEIASSKSLIPVNDFLLRAWLEKPKFAFCGIPKILMVTKTAERNFSEVNGLLEEFKIDKLCPPSGFASGMREITEWEKLIRYHLIAYPVMKNFKMWTPRTSEIVCANKTQHKIKLWQSGQARVPDENYLTYLRSSIASLDFKLIGDYPSLEEMFSSNLETE